MQLRVLASLGLASVIACSAAPVLEGTGEAVSKASAGISTTDILNRAQEWVNDKVPYCGGPRGGADVLCGGTCNRPAAAWDAYRSDCSGFVSWTWQITDDPSTDGYIVDRSGPDGWSTVAISDLKPGDALVCDGHIKLFAGWMGNDFSQAQVYEESDCGLVAQKNTQTLVKSDDTHFTIAGDGRIYHGIRRSSVTETGGANASSGGGANGSGGATGSGGNDSVGEGTQTFLFPNQQHYMMSGANGEVAHAFFDGADNLIHKDVWNQGGAAITGEPTTLVSGTQQHVWARGTKGSLEHWFWDQATNQITHDTWASGGLASDPTSALTGGGQHVWAVDTAGKLQHWYWTADAGLQHDTWGTGLAPNGRPSAMPQDPAQHVFARGTSGSLEHYWWEPTGGMHHDTWGNGITSDPAASIINGDQHVWAVDGQGALQHWWWTASGKTIAHDTWADSGLAPTARPSILAHGTGQHVFARGPANTVEHYDWEPSVGVTHDTWGQGLATTSTVSAILIGDDEHVFAQDAAGKIQHWYSSSGAMHHDSW